MSIKEIVLAVLFVAAIALVAPWIGLALGKYAVWVFSL